MAERRHGSGTLLAWAIHGLTASGAVLALLAVAAVADGRWREALLWLLAALVIDGIDGTLARAVEVRQRLPNIDGTALDLVVDYLTYVFVPAWMLWRIGAFPSAVEVPLVAVILVSSLYTFVRRDMKTDDGYFRGFPALWNIFALYAYGAAPPPWLAATLAAVLVVMTFAPIYVVHPFRVHDFQPWLTITNLLWMISTVLMLLPLALPWSKLGTALSLVSAAVLVAMGLARSLRRRPAQ